MFGLRHMLLALLPSQTFHGSTGPYLTKFGLINLGKRLVRLRLHYFHRSDEDTELHNHPWKWAVSLILKGGYTEERWVDGRVRRRTWYPGMINVIHHDTFHRVDLLDPKGAWSLFLSGPVVSTWYFFDYRRGWQIHWKEFIRSKGLKPAAEAT